MDETDKMSNSKRYVLHVIGSIEIEISLTTTSSTLKKEALHETNTEKSHAAGENKQNVTIPIPTINREKVHFGMFML